MPPPKRKKGRALTKAGRAEYKGGNQGEQAGLKRKAEAGLQAQKDHKYGLVACFGTPSPLQQSPATAAVVQRFCSACKTMFADEIALVFHTCGTDDGRCMHVAVC
jgi:hypothetical protein